MGEILVSGYGAGTALAGSAGSTGAGAFRRAAACFQAAAHPLCLVLGVDVPW